MRRPVRDERFFDSDGNPWQVLEVGKWRTETRLPDPEREPEKPRRPIPCGPFTVAFYRMVNLAGGTVKIPAHEFDWVPDRDSDGNQIGDPLEGKRKEITRAVRAGKGILIFDGQAPVRKGERYHLPCGQIVIGKVTSKTNKRGEKHDEVTFTHLDTDKVFFLRNTVPAAKPGELVKPPTEDDIEHARIEGNYLTGAPDSGGDPLPTVPPSWEDQGVGDREMARREALRAERAEENRRRLTRQVKAQLDEVNRLGAKGVDLTNELQDIYDRLNGTLKEAA